MGVGTVLLDICLVIAAAGLLMLTSIRGQSFGPEGAVGLHIAVFPPLLLIGFVLVMCILRDRLGWVPGGKVVQFGLLVGVLAATGTAAFAQFDRNASWSLLAAALPLAVVAACALVVHGAARSASAAVLGTASVAGWVLLAFGIGIYMKHEAERARAHEQVMRQQEAERAAQHLAEFRALPADAPLLNLLQYAFSPEPAVQKECRERIAMRPNLDDELIVLLDKGWAESAVDYIAKVHPKPGAKLAPAFGGFLERELPGWKSRFMGANPAQWQPNLSPYFEGAERIQKAGGDLRKPLQLWHDELKATPGMSGIAAYVQGIINQR